MKKFIVISGVCMVKRCKLVTTKAVAFNGGFIAYCAKHDGANVELDTKAMDKLIAAINMTKHVKTRT